MHRLMVGAHSDRAERGLPGEAFEGLTWQTPLGSVTMRADHQAVHAGIVGLSKFSSQYGFGVLDRVAEMPADQIMPPVGMDTAAWLKTLK